MNEENNISGSQVYRLLQPGPPRAGEHHSGAKVSSEINCGPDRLRQHMIKSMRTTLMSRTFGIFLSLLLLCSCATTPEPSAIIPASELPADVTINKDAGRGNKLIVTFRLESGEELPFRSEEHTSE